MLETEKKLKCILRVSLRGLRFVSLNPDPISIQSSVDMVVASGDLAVVFGLPRLSALLK
jgi:hypothetical protein